MYLNYLDDSRENLVVNFSNITFPFFVVKTRNFQLHAGHFHLLITYMLGLFGTLKLALALQLIVTNAYFSVACNTKVSVRATLK